MLCPSLLPDSPAAIGGKAYMFILRFVQNALGNSKAYFFSNFLVYDIVEIFGLACYRNFACLLIARQNIVSHLCSEFSELGIANAESSNAASLSHAALSARTLSVGR